MSLSNDELERIRKRKEKLQNESNSGTSNKGSTLSESEKERIRKRKDSSQSVSSIVDDTYLSTFFRDSQSFLNSAQTSYKKLDYNSAVAESSKSYFDDLAKRENDLRNRATTIRDYLNTNRSQFDDDSYKELSSYLDIYSGDSISKAFYDARDYYSQWETEDAYLDYDKKSKLDTAAAQNEIDQLERDIREYRGITRFATDERKARAAEIRELYGVESEKELEALLNEKKSFLTEADALQTSIKERQAFKEKYYSLMDEEDFEKYSYAGSIIENPSVSDAESDGRFLWWEWDGDEVGNIVTYSRDNADVLAMAGGGTQGNYLYRNMTDDEVKIYNYLLAKYGKEKGDEFLSEIMGVLSQREGGATSDRLQAIDIPVLEQLVIGGYGLMAGVDQWASGTRQYFTDEKLPVSAMQYANADLLNSMDGIGKYAYNATNVVGNMLPSIVLSKGLGALGVGVKAAAAAGTTAMSIGAAGNAYADGLDYGMEPWQAKVYGTLVGAAEGALEYAMGGIPALRGADDFVEAQIKMIDNSLLRVGAKVGWDIVQEIGEEELQNFLEPAFRAIFTGEYDAPTVEELIETAIVTAISTPAMGAAGTAINDIHGSRVALKEYGGKTDALIQEGLQSDVNTDSYKLAQQFQQQVQGTEGKAGKALTGNQIRNLLEANQEQITPKDMKKIQEAAAKRLTELGETGDVAKIAELATKYATGQKLSKNERHELAASKYGSRVYNELLPKNIASGDYTTEWAEDIQTKQVNREAYNMKNTKAIVRDIVEAMSKVEDPNAYESLENRVKAEEPAKVSDTGKAVIRTTGEEIDLTSPTFKQISDDGVVLDVNGKSVNANDIDYVSDDQGLAINSISKIEHITPAAASALYAKLDMTKDVMKQLNGMDEAFSYGFYHFSEADLNAGNFVGNLTQEQKMDAYNLGKYVAQQTVTDNKEAVKKMRTAADAVAEKAAAEGKAAPKGKKLSITYNHGGGVIEDIGTALKKLGKLEKEQRGGIEAAKILHQMGIGTDFELFTSYYSKTLKDDEGNPLEVFLDDDGTEQAAYAGIYMAADGKIRINLNAYSGTKGLTLNALSHELTHFIKTWSLEKYEAMAEFLVKSYGEHGVSMNDLVLKEQARLKEIRKKDVSYSEAYDEVVANAFNRMLEDGKVMERIAEIRQFDKSLANKIIDCIKKFINRFFNVYRDNKSLFKETEALMEMKEVFEQLQNMFAEALVDASDNFQAAQQVGFVLDTQTESVAPAVAMKSENTWKQSDYVQERDKAAAEIAKAIGVSEKKAKDYIDSINSIAKMIAEDRSRLDYFSSPGRSSFVGNVEYGGSFDFSTLCKKRRLLTGTFTAIQKALPNTALTADEILDIRNRMKEANLEVSCGLCYVEGSRANMGQFAKEFLRLYKQYYPDAWQPNMADVNTPDGIEWVRINHPECYEQYEYFWNHYGTLKDGDKNLFASQQKPKLYQLHTEYKGEILNKFKDDDNVEEKNLNGGIRLQSFSDFEIVHLIDTMQIIMDMSRVGLSGQAYTKVPDFAWALGDTGLKINLSLIAKGVDENGKLIFDDVEGMPIADAMKLRDRYSKNVGTILVAFNDEQLMAAMADDRVDYIIPFHRSQWKKSQYGAMGLPAKTKDYTYMQNEKFIKPQFHEYRGRMVQDKATNYMPNEYWDFSKSGKENAEAYLEMCARNNKRPKFYKLLQNNGDGNYSLKADGSTDGYWKLLIDFKMYDNDGNGSPQMPVTPEFNMEEANRMLNDYKGGHSNFPVAQGIVDSFVKDYKASHKGVQYSSQQTDLDTISVSDIVTTANGSLAVNINSRASGLHGHRKGEWPALVSEMIRKSLVGKAIIAEDGDIITVTRRGAREVGFGTDTKNLKAEAKSTNNYSKVEQKMITAEHAASIIALSRYSNWSSNTEDPTDMFKRDGLNYRTVEMLIDGVPHTATVVTALNADPKQIEYGEKFYDIESIEKQTNSTASYGTPNVGATPHKIKMADSSSDRLTIAQKQRIVNRQNATYSTGDTSTKTAMAEAFKNAKALKSTQQTDNITDRDMLANAFETISRSSSEYEMIQDYKSNVDQLNKLERELDDVNHQIRDIRFGTGKWDAAKLKDLEAKQKQLSKEITKYDQRLLNMEASAPLRKVIQQERKKEAERTKAHIKEIQQNKKVRAEQTELRHKIRKTVRDLDKILNRGNKKQNVKEDMKGFVSKALELADYIFTDHISNDELIRRGIDDDLIRDEREARLVNETTAILSKLYDNADSLTDEEFTRLDAKRKANEDKLRGLLTAQRNRRLNTPVYNLFSDLVTEYASFKNSKQEAVKGAYDPKVEEFLRSYIGEANGETDSDRVTLLQNMRVADMTTDELWKLHNAYQMVLHSVRTANKLFASGNTATLEQMVTQIVTDFGSRKIPEKKLAIAAQKISNMIGWDYEKLYYALDRIGSNAFTELIMNLANSENTVMQDIIEAAEFRDEIVAKYGFNNWDINKTIDREFLDNTGKKFNLTLGQMMSLYAYSRREGAWDHIEYGGFAFGKAALTNPKPADSYKLSKEQCEAITSLLTKEQKSYVEDMQKFLSETMGEKGNEVSMLLYGIKMFNEKNYFPIHIAGQFKAQANESQAKAAEGFQSMSNAGFTHAQNPNAKAPFVLEAFNDVWADHVNEMSRYHGTVPALEDIRRVMNRSSYSESTAESTSVKVVMENHFGKEAVKYFDNLYREANSGAINDRLQQTSKKMLSLFRKNSVAYSLSVLVQQPASIVRAYAMIDRKYFGFKGVGVITSGVAKAVFSNKKAYANAYNEMLKYAPGVTMTKEIGGFDTATGGSIRTHLLDTKKNFKQKWKTGTALEKGKAVLSKVDDNAIANLPNVADKIAWIEIWNACKRETVAKHKDLAAGSDEFMKIVGDRFTEVIRATQVYDSIFAKSPMLKSKNLAVQYLVSFMNEPNTVANMAEKAVRDLATKGDRLQGARTVHVLIHSILFTGVMKSLIYALRDDDEDETYIEKYIESLAGSLLDDFNPLNYIPIARDVWSVVQGYDVERADMAIVSDAIGALNKVIKAASTDREDLTEDELIELDKKVTKASWDLVEAIAAFVGIPMKNVRREVIGILNTATADPKKSTKLSIKDTIVEAVIDSIPFMGGGKSKTDKIYAAVMEGDQAYLDRIKSTYKSEDAYHKAVRTALRENDSRIREAALAQINGNPSERVRIINLIKADGFDQDDVDAAINSEINALTSDGDDSSSSKVKGLYKIDDFVTEAANGDYAVLGAIRDDIISTAVKNGKTQSEAEKDFASNVVTETKDAFYDSLLDEAGAKKLLMEYGGKDKEEAVSKVNYWAMVKANPKYKDILNESNVSKYYEFAKPVNISVDVFVQYLTRTKGLKKDQVIEIIDSLPLTWKQKDALYLAHGYAESQIDEVPW